MSTWRAPAGSGYRFTSDYGPRTSPGGIGSTFHRGVDLAPPTPGQGGFAILAPAPGTIIARAFSTVRGHWTAIRHDDGAVSRYQHFPIMPFHAGGTRVATGQVLGHMGASGAVTGVHLHHEVFPPGADWTSSANAIDPEPWYRARGVDLRTGATLVTNPTTPTAPTTPTLPTLPTLPAPIEEIALHARAFIIRNDDSGAIACVDLDTGKFVVFKNIEQFTVLTELATAIGETYGPMHGVGARVYDVTREYCATVRANARA